jgi:hypothetical protein
MEFRLMKKCLLILTIVAAIPAGAYAKPNPAAAGRMQKQSEQKQVKIALQYEKYTNKAEYKRAMDSYPGREAAWQKNKSGPRPKKPYLEESFGQVVGGVVNSGATAIKTNFVDPATKLVGDPIVQNFLKPTTNLFIMPVLNTVVKPAATFVNDNFIQPVNNAFVQPALNGINNGLAAAANSDNGFLKVLGKTGQVAMVGAKAMGEVMSAPIRLPVETAKTAVKTAEAISKGDTTGALLGGLQMKLDRDGVSRVTDMGKTWENSKKGVDKVVPGLGTVGGMVVESVPVIGDAVSAAGSAYKVQEAVKKGKYDEALGEAALAGVGFIGKGAGKAASGATHIAAAAAMQASKRASVLGKGASIAASAAGHSATKIGNPKALAAAAQSASKLESGILKTVGTKIEGAAQSVGGLATKTDSTILKTVATKLESKGDSLAKLANRVDDAIAKATNTGAQDVALANKMMNKLDVTTVADAQKLATNLNRVEKATDIVDMTQKAGDIKQAIDYATGAASPDDDDDDNKPDDDKKDDKPAAAGDPNANRAIALAPVNNNGGAAQAAPVNANPVVAPSITHRGNVAATKSFNSFSARKSHSPATSAAILSKAHLAVVNAVVAKGVIAPAPAPKPVVQTAPLPDPNSGGGNPNPPAPAGPTPGAQVAGGFDYIFKFFNDDDDDDTIHISSTTLTGLNHDDVDITGNPDDASFGPIIVPKGSHGVTLKGAHYGTSSPNDIKGTMRVLPGGAGAAVRSGGDQKFHLFIRDTRNPRDTQTLNVHAK